MASTRKKIAIVVPDLTLGGGQRVAVNTAELLARSSKWNENHTSSEADDSNEVHVITFHDENTLFETNLKRITLDCPERKNIFFKVLNIFKRVKRLRSVLKKENYDVVISFLESANLAAYLSNKNSILTIHSDPKIISTFDKYILRYVLKKSENIVAVSEGLKNLLENKYPLKQVSVIHNVINLIEIESFGNQDDIAVHQLPRKENRKYIVAVGRLVDEKRFDVLIDAFERTKASQNCDLIIVGDGENRKKLEEKTSSMSANIVFLGEIKNPFPIIKWAEFYALSSETEAFPMVLLESLALETPIVAFDCPVGVKEIVINNENGLLVENDNVDALAKSMDTLFYDQALRERLSKNCVSSLERFNSNEIYQNWMNFFEEKRP